MRKNKNRIKKNIESKRAKRKQNLPKKSKTGVCVLCGKIGELTKDHVPTKGLWDKPRTNDLIKVPTCVRCNVGSSKNNLFFAFHTLADERVIYYNNARSAFNHITDTLRTNPKLADVKYDIISNMKESRIYTKEDRGWGKSFYRNKDKKYMDMMYKEVNRTVKGLFYYETKRILSEDYGEISLEDSWLKDSIEALSNDQNTKNMMRQYVELCANAYYNGKKTSISNGNFQYFVNFDKNDPNVSFWCLIFYRKIVYFCATLKKNI